MAVPNMQDVNNDARTLREEIDGIHNRLVDETGIHYADLHTNPLYDAVTRLHELAASAVRANQAAGIGS